MKYKDNVRKQLIKRMLYSYLYSSKSKRTESLESWEPAMVITSLRGIYSLTLHASMQESRVSRPADSSNPTQLGSLSRRKRFKGCLDWDSFATFLRLFSDADAQVRKRRDSFASTQATQLCRVRRVGWPTHSRLLHGGVILRVKL